MKAILTLAGICLCSLVFGQYTPILNSNISGSTNVSIGETKSYSFPGLSGGNYFWSSLNSNLLIQGSNTGSSINVLANGAGVGTLCITRYKAGKEPISECLSVIIDNCLTVTPSSLSGPSNICNSNYTYSTPSITSAILYQWKVNNTGYTTTTSANTVTISGSNFANGSNTFKVRYKNSCNQWSAWKSKTVIKGSIGTAGSIGGPSLISDCNQSYDYTILVFGAVQWHWEIVGSSFSQTTSEPSVTIPGFLFSNGVTTLRARGSDACGNFSNWTTKHVYEDCNQIPLLVYPNPTTQGVVVSLKGINKEFTGEMKVSVFDKNNLKIIEKSESSSQFEINNLKEPGVYLIKVEVEGKVYTSKVLVE